jgi:hypothetical protein
MVRVVFAVSAIVASACGRIAFDATGEPPPVDAPLVVCDPGAPEICDALDNDCNAATIETCPASCQVKRRPAPDDAHAYLFCSTTASGTTRARRARPRGTRS